MLFFTSSNVNDQFVDKKLIWKFYTTVKVLTTTKKIEFNNKKEFAKVTLNRNARTFVVHMASLNLAPVSIYPDKKS